MIVEVVQPIFGFEHIYKYKFKKIDDFFYTIESGNISFTLIDSSMIIDNYHFDIPKKYKNSIDTKNDIQVYNIVTILNPIEESTINFLAPILISKKENKLLQIVLDEKKYPNFGLRQPIKNFI